MQDKDQKQARGRLKVFFGASRGTGKTYAMLRAARSRKSAHSDVVAGCIEPPLEDFESIPLRNGEFDLDAALARRPELLLVDELAHANAPGSRHVKRWQDVLELLAAGIDVYTTLNVHDVDSLNDMVAQVTGVVVRETVPDSVLDQADEIELVDVSVDEVLRRIEEGKVHVGEDRDFFRPGNLFALRELALRTAAGRVDAQMRDFRRDHGIQAAWPVTERVIVCVGTSPFSGRLIRATRRMASSLNAEWIAAFVEAPGFPSQPQEVRDRVLAAMRLAGQLGAETVTLSGTSVAQSVLRYARSKNVSRIVVGKRPEPRWKRLLRGSILDDLIAQSGGIEIHAITGEPGDPLPSRRARASAGPRTSWQEFAIAVAAVAACTGVSLLLRPFLAPANLVMFYLLGVVAVAMRCSRQVSFVACFLSVAAFDFFCVPPYLTFVVSEYQYAVTLGVMLTVALAISTLTARMRAQAAHVVDREARTQSLFRLSRELAGAARAFDAARIATELTREILASKTVIFLPNEDGRITFRRRTTDQLPVPTSEEAIAQWVFENGQPAGKGMDTLPRASALYLPLKGSRRMLGVMAVVPEGAEIESPEQQHFLEIFATQTALAMERSGAASAAREARVKIETEQLRSSLLSAVSHDLRTPLASITGAATTLLERGDRFDAATRRELLESIAEEADRLGRLVSNLLEMTKLESGVELRQEWHPVEEIIGAALTRLDKILTGRSVQTNLASDLPLIPADDVLLEHVFLNLIENAVKYTPAGMPIEIVARAETGQVVIEIKDRGPGFADGEEERVFEKFYRGKRAGKHGAGLGLSICRAIVGAHKGMISAGNRPDGGAILRICLPLGEAPAPAAPPLEVADRG